MIRPLIFLAAVAAMQPQHQFDLICKGTSQGYPVSRPEAGRYHVDLDANKWCRDSCTVRPLAEVDSRTLWFQRQRETISTEPKIIEYVDRVTGAWRRVMGPWVTDGTCEAAPFTGFPTPPTKF